MAPKKIWASKPQRSHPPAGSSPYRPLRRSPPSDCRGVGELQGVFRTLLENMGETWEKTPSSTRFSLKSHDSERISSYPTWCVECEYPQKKKTFHPLGGPHSEGLSALMLAAVAIGKFEVKMIWASTVIWHVKGSPSKSTGSLATSTWRKRSNWIIPHITMNQDESRVMLKKKNYSSNRNVAANVSNSSSPLGPLPMPFQWPRPLQRRRTHRSPEVWGWSRIRWSVETRRKYKKMGWSRIQFLVLVDPSHFLRTSKSSKSWSHHPIGILSHANGFWSQTPQFLSTWSAIWRS